MAGNESLVWSDSALRWQSQGQPQAVVPSGIEYAAKQKRLLQEAFAQFSMR